MDKRTMRAQMLEMLKKMDQQTYEKKSAEIALKLFSDPAYKQAGTIGITISSFPEVDTIEIIRASWEAGKRVAVPKCTASSRKMDFYVIERLDQLEVVYFNLKEPKIDETEYAGPEEIDLLIVPGVVYNANGFRIGFGGGFYDRYLADYDGATRSLAFDCQIVEEIPVERHDVPVDGILTESKMIRMDENR